MADKAPVTRLVALQFGIEDRAFPTEPMSFVDYDIGLIADVAVEALLSSILAFEQIVTGDKLVNASDVGDFYRCLNTVLEQMNGQGVMSEPGDMCKLHDEIQAVLEIIRQARETGRRAEGKDDA